MGQRKNEFTTYKLINQVFIADHRLQKNQTAFQASLDFIILGATEQALELQNKTLPLWQISCSPSDATPQVQVTNA